VVEMAMIHFILKFAETIWFASAIAWKCQTSFVVTWSNKDYVVALCDSDHRTAKRINSDADFNCSFVLMFAR
jgi:hypothetical protein